MVHYITTNGIGNAWVAVELRTMQQRGIPVALHSLRKPHQNFLTSNWAQQINHHTHVIYPLSLPALLHALLLAPLTFNIRFFHALANACFAPRESFRARLASLAHFGVACLWARRLQHQPVSLIHAQWVHSSGTIAMYAAWLLDVPFSFTGHAVDLFRDRVALADKIRRAAMIASISSFHRSFYLDHGAREQQIVDAPCGIDLADFPFHHRTAPRHPAHIVSVGRLVEKKGLTYLIDACARLHARGIALRCTIAGDGPLTDSLREQVAHLKLQHTVEITGKPISQDQLADFLADADLFAQPCVWSSDNDVDGTPRTLMEAMASGIPSIAARIAGLPDIIEHERSGLLVEPNDSQALADAIHRLLSDHTLYAQLSRAGRERIEQRFALPHCLDPLEQRFRTFLQTAPAPAARPEQPMPEPVAMEGGRP